MFLRFLAVLCYLSVVSQPCLALAENSVEQAFKEWFEDNGGVFKKIDVFQSEAMGRGLIAVEDIQENDLIIKVPANVVLSMKTLRQATDPSLQLLTKGFEPETALAGWLLYEKCRGDESFFKPYIDILPTYISSLIYFSKDELHELENPEFFDEALLMQEVILREHAQFAQAVSSLWRLPQSCISLSEFQWALAILNSRGLRFKGELYLTPMADMFNHEPHPDPRVSQNGQFFLQHHSLGEDGGVSISSDRAQPKGAQVYEDYGDNNDETYLKYHGFVADYNPFRCVKINTSEWLSELPALSSTKQKLISSFEFRGPPVHCIGGNGIISKSVLVYAAILAFTDHETSVCARIIKKKHSKSWNDIFKGCGLADINDFVNSLDSDSSSKIDLSVTDDFDDVPLNHRVLAVLQKGIARSSSFSVATSIEDDKLILNAHVKLAEHLGKPLVGSDSSVAGRALQERANFHKIQAVKYRLLRKELWKQVCTQYAAHCSVLDGKLEPVDISVYTAKISAEEPMQIHTVQHTVGTSAATEDRIAEVDISGAAVLHSNDNTKSDAASVLSLSSLSTDDAVLQAKLDTFNAWFTSFLGGSPCKIAAAIIPGFRIGTVAIADISAEEEYLGVPDAVIMSSDTAAQTASIKSGPRATSSPAGKVITSLREKFQFSDDFHELLVSLLYEYHVLREKSVYWPYLSLLPRVDELDVPLMWSPEKTETLLKSSTLYDTVVNYQAQVSRKFSMVSKVDLVTDLFTSFKGDVKENIFTFANYRWATVIIDSRSIWWHGKRHLVPMLDFVNCMENAESPARVHSTKWDDHREVAVTLAGREYEGGGLYYVY